MLNKVVLVVTLFAASAIAAPSKADNNAACLLSAGCFFQSPAGGWICPNPETYMLCIDE